MPPKILLRLPQRLYLVDEQKCSRITIVFIFDNLASANHGGAHLLDLMFGMLHESSKTRSTIEVPKPERSS